MLPTSDLVHVEEEISEQSEKLKELKLNRLKDIIDFSVIMLTSIVYAVSIFVINRIYNSRENLNYQQSIASQEQVNTIQQILAQYHFIIANMVNVNTIQIGISTVSHLLQLLQQALNSVEENSIFLSGYIKNQRFIGRSNLTEENYT